MRLFNKDNQCCNLITILLHTRSTCRRRTQISAGMNYEKFAIRDLVLLSSMDIQVASITNFATNKLAPSYIGPFKFIKTAVYAYTLDIPTTMRLHLTFYVGHLKRYHTALLPSHRATLRAHTAVPYDVAFPAVS